MDKTNYLNIIDTIESCRFVTLYLLCTEYQPYVNFMRAMFNAIYVH